MTVGFKGRSTLAVLVGFALVGCTERGAPDGTESAGTPVVTTVPVSGTTMSSTTGGTMPNTTGPSGLQRSSPDPMAAPLLGLWVRDDVGPVLTYQRRFQFNADGSYQFLVTSRNPGSASGTVVAREDGRFRVQGDQLSMQPLSGGPRTVVWRVDQDPYVGDTRFVIVLPDGTLDVYYRA